MESLSLWLEWYGIKYGYLFLIVLTLAALEVQIEGRHGWMKKIPTWRIKSKLFGFFMGGKELTGYLFYTLLLLILFFHFPFLGGAMWSFAAEIEIISLLVLFSVFWDFLWFVINPYYGINRFKKQYVYWHKKWFLGVPLDYIRGIFISGVISCLAFPLGFAKWLYALCIFALGSLAIICIRRFVLRS